MLYLAQVEKRRHLTIPGKLVILAVQGANGMWVKHNEIVIYHFDRDRIGEGALVLIQLSSKRQVMSMESAADEIVRSLLNFTAKTLELKEQWDEISLWRNSLHYQTVELEQRKKEVGEDHDRRELALKLQESSIKDFSKIMLEREQRKQKMSD